MSDAQLVALKEAYELKCIACDLLREAVLELSAKNKSIMQAISDPENQPSQYGTITLELHEAKIAQAKKRG